MHDRPVHAIEQLVEYPFAGEHGADRNMSAGERFGDQHQVGLDTPVFEREEAAGAAHAGLDFVGDHQGSVLAAQRERLREIVVRGQVYALALDRLDHEGRDLPGRERALQRRKVVEGNFGAIRQEGAETLAEDFVADQRDRTIGEAMEGMTAIDEPRPAGGCAGELDGGFDRFGAGIGEEHLLAIGNPRQQPLGKHAGERRHVHLHEIGQVGIEHALEHVAHRRMIAADREHAPPAQQVEVFRPVPVVEVLAAPRAKSDVIADGLEHPHHLLVEVARVQCRSDPLRVRRTGTGCRDP